MRRKVNGLLLRSWHDFWEWIRGFGIKSPSISVVKGLKENVRSMAQCIVKRELRYFLNHEANYNPDSA